MMIHDFGFARIPEIIFGIGKINLLYAKITLYGDTIILLTSGGSFIETDRFDELLIFFKKKSIQFSHYKISGEPSPKIINEIVQKTGDRRVDVVVSIGGGSVLDAGKAVSAMLGKKDPVELFLEGVGTKLHDGSKVPFIAVPATAGTGSEATKNAVLTQLGENGFKKSMRHDNFVPDIALVDPELTMTCPANVTAACGLDAFTQLLESYVSTGASQMTDALAYSGLKLLKDNLIPAVTDGASDLKVRSVMSYSALISGITLANAGLGIVHGLASPLGAYYDIPHGVACGTLVGAATKINIAKLKKSGEAGLNDLKKYAKIGQLFSEKTIDDIHHCAKILVDRIEEWVDFLKIPKLAEYGVREDDIDNILAETGNKNNPVKLNKEDIRKILMDRM